MTGSCQRVRERAILEAKGPSRFSSWYPPLVLLAATLLVFVPGLVSIGAASYLPSGLSGGTISHTPAEEPAGVLSACQSSSQMSGTSHSCAMTRRPASETPDEAGTVVATIPVGCGPYGATYDSAQQEIFVVNSCGNSVSVISATTNTVVATVPIPSGSDPQGVTYDSKNGYVYTGNVGAGTVTVVNSATNSVVTTISPAGYYPWGVDYDSRNGYVYVANDGSGDTLQVISGTSIIKSIVVGSSPDGVTYDGENGDVYTANSGTRTLSEVSGSTNTVIATISYAGWYPYWVAYGAKSGNVYIADVGGADVYVISGYTNALVATIPMPTSSVEMAYDSGNNYAYATNCGSGDVYVIDGSTNTYLTAVATGSGACGVIYDPANGDVYVADSGANAVSVLSTSNPQTTVPTASPGDVDISQSSTLTTTPSGGVPPYTYVWNNLPPGCASKSVTTITCTPTGAGYFNITVTIKDSTGFSTTSGALPFQVYTDPTVTVPVPTRAAADEKQTVTFNTTAGGGTGSYVTYAWAESSPGLGCALANAASIACTPTLNGSYTVSVFVTDSNSCSSGTAGGCGAAPTSSAAFFVYTDPAIGVPTAAPPIIDAEETVNFTSATPTGGLPPYAYTWNGLPKGCTNSGNPLDTCTPLAGGTYNISVTITDANGYAVTSGNLTYVVNSTLSVILTASIYTLDVGQSMSFYANVSHGTMPYVYQWSYPAQMGCSPSTASNLDCKPTSPSIYTISIIIVDKTGKTVGTSVIVTVNPQPTVVLSGTNATDVGLKLKYTTTATGGSIPYSYKWTFSAGLGCLSTNNSTIKCTPLKAGLFPLTVVLSDRVGGVSTSTIAVEVHPDPQIALAGVLKADVGQQLVFTSFPSNGTMPYTLNWTYPGSLGCSPSANITLSCSPIGTGKMGVRVRLADSVGLTATANISLTVSSDPRVTLEGKNSTGVQRNLTYVAYASGGTPPYAYAWTFPSQLGCASPMNNTVECSPDAAGNYTISILVVDSVGENYSASILVHVAPLPPTYSQPSELPWWIPGLIVSLVLILAFYVLARRTRRQSTEKEKEEAASPVATTTVAAAAPAVAAAPEPAAAPAALPEPEPEPVQYVPETPEALPADSGQYQDYQDQGFADQDYQDQGYPDAYGQEPLQQPMSEPEPEPTTIEMGFPPQDPSTMACPQCGATMFRGRACPVCGSLEGNRPPLPDITPGQYALLEYLNSYHAPEPEPLPPPPVAPAAELKVCPKCKTPLPSVDAECPICTLKSKLTKK